MQRKTSLSINKKSKTDTSNFNEVLQLSVNMQPKKKTFTYQRISQKSMEITKNIRQQTKKNNLKVQRKDTASTNQENITGKVETNQQRNQEQLQNLVYQSKQDPFMRYKLKAFVKNELKTLSKGSNINQKSQNLIQTQKFGSKDNNKKQQQILKLLSDSIILTDSVKSSNDFSSNQSVSTQSKGPSTPICERITNSFLWDDNKDQQFIKTQIKTPNNLTTLKAQQEKTKSQKYKILRFLSLKQPNQISQDL